MGKRDDPAHKFQTARKKIVERHENGQIPTPDYEHIIDFADAKDPDEMTVQAETDLSHTTLRGYCRLLDSTARRLSDVSLVTADADDINSYISSLSKGTHPDVDDDGFAHATVRQYQATLRAFYGYHESLGVDPEDIVLSKNEETPVDERHIFDRDDVEAMREACPNARDRAILELLLNTGQRVRAIQTLRIEDVDLDDGVFYLNEDDGGLKHASGKRPLLGAHAPLQRWLDHHPCPNDSEAYVITHLPSSRYSDPHSPLNQNSIRKRLRKIGKKAGIEKPVNPHNFRHFAVTTMYRDYDMDTDTIKFIIGHDAESRVMETTYRHLTDDDYVKRAEVAAGFREPDEGKPLTPSRCPRCDESLEPQYNRCPTCGETFSPVAEESAQQVQDAIYEGKGELPDNEAVDDLRELVENDPEFMEKLLRLRDEMS